MGRKRATRDSWQNMPKPAARVSLDLNRTFSGEEHQLLCLGLIPEVMEDKWFSHVDGDWLSFHRSWTGYCIYLVRLAHEDGV
jgi:hypothetical protein